MTIPHQDANYGHLGPAFPNLAARSRDAILQPPRPLIPPSSRVVELARRRESEIEAVN